MTKALELLHMKTRYAQGTFTGTCKAAVILSIGEFPAPPPFRCSYLPNAICFLAVGLKKKTKAQKEAERLQAEEDERKAEILRAKREAERIRKEEEDAKRLKEEQVRVRAQA